MSKKSNKKQQKQNREVIEKRIESLINTLGVMTFIAGNQDLNLSAPDRLKAISFEIEILATKLGINEPMVTDYIGKIDYVGNPFTVELQSAIQSLDNGND